MYYETMPLKASSCVLEHVLSTSLWPVNASRRVLEVMQVVYTLQALRRQTYLPTFIMYMNMYETSRAFFNMNIVPPCHMNTLSYLCSSTCLSVL